MIGKQRKGATAGDYALLVGLVSVVALGAITNTGGAINELFGSTASTLGNVVENGEAALPQPSASASAPVPTDLASCNALKLANPGLSDGSYTIDPDGPGGNAPISATCDMTTDGGGYTLIYDYVTPGTPLNIDAESHADAMAVVNLSAQPISYSRVAYRMELDSRYAFAAMDDFTGGQLNRTGIPADWIHDTTTSNLFVESNDSIVTAANNANGKLEFWSNCYGTNPDSLHDSDDTPSTTDCYGSMQIFNMTAGGQTVMAFNAWSYNQVPDLGIGTHVQNNNTYCPNNPPGPDWTFCHNSAQYSSRHIKVYVK